MMLRHKVLLLLSTTLCIGLAAPAFSAEELFDTKASHELLEKGVMHLAAKNYISAITVFEEAASIAPDAEAFYYLGYAYYMKGKTRSHAASWKKSIENFDKAYELNPDFTPTRFKPEFTPSRKPKAKVDDEEDENEVTVSSDELTLKERTSPLPEEKEEEGLTDEELEKEVE